MTTIYQVASALGAFMLTLTAGVQAADFPNKEVKVIVNYGAGGGVDRTARSMQKFLPAALGQSVIVENHKGAGGKIGLKKFLAEPRDGYTVLTAFAPATTVVKFKNPGMFKMEDLAIINVQWTDPAIIVARKDTGWKSLDDMITAVKANPGKFSFGSSGKGSVGPLLSNILFKKLGLDIKIVPYKGGGKTRAAFKGGHVHMTAAGAGGALKIKDDAIVLGAFWPGVVANWPNAKPLNGLLKKYNLSVPEGGAYRFHAVHRDVKDKHPGRFAKLVEAYKKVTTTDTGFKEFMKKTKVGGDWFGPEKSQKLIAEVDRKFTDILKGN